MYYIIEYIQKYFSGLCREAKRFIEYEGEMQMENELQRRRRRRRGKREEDDAALAY